MAIGYLVVDLLPALLARTDGLEPEQKAEEMGRIRVALVTLVAGAAAAIGAAYTARTFALNRRGQGTERFTRAIDQLGNMRSLDVRLGGIYALGQLARDSPQEYGAIVDILTAYVREHYRWPPPRITAQRVPEPTRAGVDVKAVIKVLQRRDRAEDVAHGVTIDLSETNLCGIHATGLALNDAHLSATQFQDASLIRAELRHANLVWAQFEGAILRSADLSRAVLRSASLRGAQLQGANLSGAELQRADLRSARYDRHTVWTGARYDSRTQWPEGFEAAAHGCVSEASETA